MLTFRLSCCRICSKYPQHWHHASLLVSNMLYWSPGSWRCYQLLLLGQLPRGRFRPESSYSPRPPFPPTEELRRAGGPTPRASHLWSRAAKHTITVPARWVRTAAAPLEGPFVSGLWQKSPLSRITRQISFKLISAIESSRVSIGPIWEDMASLLWECVQTREWFGGEQCLTLQIVFWVQNLWW